MNKTALISAILAQLNKELAIVVQSAHAAHEGATHEENKAENKYDTRGLEAAYLAGAQAKRAEQIKATIHYFSQLKPQSFTASTPIHLTAYVTLAAEGKSADYFLAGLGGGLSVQFDGKGVFVIASQSPLGQNLLGRQVGDCFEIATKHGPKTYEIIAVQ